MPIRLATPADAPGIARVHVASWQTSYRGIVPDEALAALSVAQRAEMWRRGLTDPARRHPILVAESGGRIVGFAAYGQPQGDGAPDGALELYAIYLLADFQRRGLGRQLWERILDEAKRLSAPVIYLWVLADNHPARIFYDRCGFVQDGTEKAIEIGGKALNEIRYRLDLNSA